MSIHATPFRAFRLAATGFLVVGVVAGVGDPTSFAVAHKNFAFRASVHEASICCVQRVAGVAHALVYEFTVGVNGAEGCSTLGRPMQLSTYRWTFAMVVFIFT